MDPLCRGVRELLALPHCRQLDAVERLLAALPVEHDEAWNSAFGTDSLFAAWTKTSVVQGVYEANRSVLRPLLDARPGWRIVEVGAGDGRLWRQLLTSEDVGELVVVDPVPQAIEAVRAAVPSGVAVRGITSGVESAVLPACDAIVCSLTLHHVAGATAAARRAVGLSGPGKAEVLALFADVLTERSGVLVLNEADVYCDLGLESGDPVLRQRLADSYVRRCARSLVDDIEAHPDAAEVPRWRAILRHWCLEQVRMAEVPVAERDVYELDVTRWTELLRHAGLAPSQVRFTDDYGLFVQYVSGRETASGA